MVGLPSTSSDWNYLSSEQFGNCPASKSACGNVQACSGSPLSTSLGFLVHTSVALVAQIYSLWHPTWAVLLYENAHGCTLHTSVFPTLCGVPSCAPRAESGHQRGRWLAHGGHTGLRGRYHDCYPGDLSTDSRSKVLDKVIYHGFTCTLEQCQLLRTSVKLLGHTVGRERGRLSQLLAGQGCAELVRAQRLLPRVFEQLRATHHRYAQMLGDSQAQQEPDSTV
jgi:hypothetical protein